MSPRDLVGRRWAWLIAVGFSLVVSITEVRSQEIKDVRPQQVKPEAPQLGPNQVESLQSTVAALRSQMEWFEQTNRELARRLDDLARQVLEDRGPKNKTPPAAQGAALDDGPTSALQVAIQDWRRFKEEVLKAVEPELAELRGQIASLEARHEGHVHAYNRGPSHGWASWLTVVQEAENCPDCLVPFRSQQSGPGLIYDKTSEPKTR